MQKNAKKRALLQTFHPKIPLTSDEKMQNEPNFTTRATGHERREKKKCKTNPIPPLVEAKRRSAADGSIHPFTHPLIHSFTHLHKNAKQTQFQNFKNRVSRIVHREYAKQTQFHQGTYTSLPRINRNSTIEIRKYLKLFNRPRPTFAKKLQKVHAFCKFLKQTHLSPAISTAYKTFYQEIPFTLHEMPVTKKCKTNPI